MSERNIKIDFGSEFTWLVILVFWVFWLQSGWYRVDCSLGVQKACALIEAEYQAKPKP